MRKSFANFSARGPHGPYLPGFARQLLNRRSGSARLRSTASQSLPCCFAERKAVLSHALAALTALNMGAGQAGREAPAALTALNGARAKQGREALAALTALRFPCAAKQGGRRSQRLSH
ncbi:MAG: hypothetical protein L6W00_30060 [Lentisphaeria bacterium]|nr:MAG: hypothetical protein L6W00_30060 [Lentisphaeria bacterium]